MTQRIVILGGGTGGTLVANRLHRHYHKAHGDVAITVIDQDNHHVYQPGLLFVPFGLAHNQEIVRPRHEQLHNDVEFIESGIERVDSERDIVVLAGGREIGYDLLVIATGSHLALDETEGLTGPGWNEKVFTFYDLPGATALEAALADFEGGRLVVNVVDMPIKCPVAPLEFCFLADWYFTERGIRDKVEITYATPLDGAFTKPVASATLASLLEEKGVHLVTEFNTGEVDGDGRQTRRLRRPRGAVRPGRGRAAAQRRRLRGPQRRPRRRSQLRPDEQVDPADAGQGEHLRHRRRHQRAGLQGRIGHPLRRRGAGRQHRPLPRGPRPDRHVRRARQLLHRDRVRQGPAHRLQLRDRAVARSLPLACRHAPAEGEPHEPPRQVDVPVVLLARPAAGPRRARHRRRHARTRQATPHHHTRPAPEEASV